jgi:hypothetical protein
MRVITAPEPLNFNSIDTNSLFLAGSIEQGKATNWQEYVIGFFKHSDVLILNPRRKEWNPSWIQSKDNPEFFEQVNWELEALQASNFRLFYFEPTTLSPISLLELGLYGPNSQSYVVCPDGFWRKGNIDIVCRKFGIPVYDNLDQALHTIIKYF